MPDANQRIDAALASITRTVPFQVAGFGALFGRTPIPINAGIAYCDSRSVRVRLEPGTKADTLDRWRQFFAGTVPSSLNGDQWALSVDEEWLLPIGRAMFTDAVATSADFHPRGNPAASWSPSGHGVTVRQSGVISDVGIFNEDADGTITLDVDYRVPTPGKLTIRVTFGASGSVGGFAGVLQDVFGLDPDLTDALPPVQGWTKVGRFTYEKTIPAAINTDLLGNLVLERIQPNPNALLISGSVDGETLTPAALFVTAEDWFWLTPKLSCDKKVTEADSEAFRRNAARILRLSVELDLTQTGTAPVRVCSIEPVNDPLGLVPTGPPGLRIDSDTLPSRIILTIDNPGPDYRSAPYDLEILITTTAGRYLTKLRPPELTPEIVDLGVAILGLSARNCDALPDWFGGKKRFDLQWIVDPLLDPDYATVTQHNWDIEITGLTPGDAVIVERPALNASAAIHGVAQQSGAVLRFSWSVPAVLGEPELTVTRVGNPSDSGADDKVPRPSSTAQQGIMVRQQARAHRSTIALPSPCVRLLASTAAIEPTLTAVMSDRITTYDLTDPTRPVATASWDQPGLRGAVPAGEGLIAFGTDGLHLLAIGTAGPTLRRHVTGPAVVDAVGDDTVLYTLTDDAIEVRSQPGFAVISNQPIIGGRCVALLGGHLLIGGRDGIHIATISAYGQATLGAAYPGLDVMHLQSTADTEQDWITALLGDGSARTFALSGGQLHEIAQYSRAADSSPHATAVGRTSLKLTADARQIEVSTVGEPRLCVPDFVPNSDPPNPRDQPKT